MRLQTWIIPLALALTTIAYPLLGTITVSVLVLRQHYRWWHTVLWIIGVWCLPVVGPFVYCLLGWHGYRKQMWIISVSLLTLWCLALPLLR